MPCLTDVYLPEAFDYKNHVTIIGGTHFILFSRIDIGALRNYFWSPRGAWLFSLCHTQPTTPTSELIQRHWRERYRCANTEIMTIRIWNDGNPIRIVDSTSNDHSLRIAYNPHHFAFQITHIASPFQWEPKPIQSTMTTQSPTLPQNSLFHWFQPINPIQMSILSQLPHYRNTHKSNHPHITLASNNTPKRRTFPFPAPLPNSLSPHPTAITQSLHHFNT